MKPPRFIFVVGPMRSGTSLIANLLASHPDYTFGGEANENGENLDFMAKNREIMRCTAGGATRGIPTSACRIAGPLRVDLENWLRFIESRPKRNCAACEFNAVEKEDDVIECWCEHGAVPTMNSLVLDEDTPPEWCPLPAEQPESGFILKDPRACFTLGIWLSLVENPAVVVALRDLPCTAESLMRTQHMDKAEAQEHIGLYYECALRNLVEYKVPVEFVKYENLLTSPLDTLGPLLRRFGLDRQKLDLDILDKNQWHFRPGSGE